LRQMLASNAELARQLTEIEKKYDAQFKVVFDAIRQLMTPPEPRRKQIGFAKTTKKRNQKSIRRQNLMTKNADPSRVGKLLFLAA
jgi:hypothetical protein